MCDGVAVYVAVCPQAKDSRLMEAHRSLDMVQAMEIENLLSGGSRATSVKNILGYGMQTQRGEGEERKGHPAERWMCKVCVCVGVQQDGAGAAVVAAGGDALLLAPQLHRLPPQAGARRHANGTNMAQQTQRQHGIEWLHWIGQSIA